MDLSEAIFTSLTAIRTADSGTGGLSNIAADAYIAKLVLKGDANYDENRAEYWPLAVVDIIEHSDTSWGYTDTRDVEGVTIIIRLRTLRDRGRTSQNAISARLKVQLDGVVPASQTGWVFSPMAYESGFQEASSGVWLTFAMRFSCRAADT